MIFRCVSPAVKKQTIQRLKFSLKNIHKIKCLTNGPLNSRQPKYSAYTKRRRVSTGDSLRRHSKIQYIVTIITTSSSHGAKLQYRMSSDRKPFTSRISRIGSRKHTPPSRHFSDGINTHCTNQNENDH